MEEEELYYKDTQLNSELILANSFEYMKKMDKESVDIIFADPPYFLSNNGFSNSGGKMVSVNKGEWDKISSLSEKHAFNRNWINLAKKILKPNGTIWISGSFHNMLCLMKV